MSPRILLFGIVFLLGRVGVLAAEPPGPGPSKVVVDSYEARGLLHIGDMAREFEAYDLAVQAYQRVMDRFPGTRWAKRAEQGIVQVKVAAKQVMAPWDPDLAAQAAGWRAQELLHAGDMAYEMDDTVIALQCYEQARAAAPESWYARRAESKIRWLRRWKDRGP